MLQPNNPPNNPPDRLLILADGPVLERFVREYQNADRPILMRGVAAQWPAVSSWTPDYFAGEFADLPINPSVSLPDTEVPYLYRDHDFRQPMTVAEFVRRMKSGDRCYLDQMSLEFYDGLKQDCDFGMFEPSDVKVIALWIGALTRSGLHYDWVDNLFVQVHGTKRFILAAPEEIRNLYPFADSHTKSRVAPQHPDLTRFPRFRRVHQFEGTLAPGDAIYIPKGWWHYFAAPEVSISLNCWYGSSLSPGHELRNFLRMRSPWKWTRFVRDFLWHGVLRRPFDNRLYSLPPTGVLLYQLIEGYVKGQPSRP